MYTHVSFTKQPVQKRGENLMYDVRVYCDIRPLKKDRKIGRDNENLFL